MGLPFVIRRGRPLHEGNSKPFCSFSGFSAEDIIVGINTYHHLRPLASPAEDAEAVARLLEQYGKFNVTRLRAVKDDTNPSGKMSRKKPVSQGDFLAVL